VEEKKYKKVKNISVISIIYKFLFWTFNVLHLYFCSFIFINYNLNVIIS
jgi:hypothetical protein